MLKLCNKPLIACFWGLCILPIHASEYKRTMPWEQGEQIIVNPLDDFYDYLGFNYIFDNLEVDASGTESSDDSDLSYGIVGSIQLFEYIVLLSEFEKTEFRQDLVVNNVLSTVVDTEKRLRFGPKFYLPIVQYLHLYTDITFEYQISENELVDTAEVDEAALGFGVTGGVIMQLERRFNLFAEGIFRSLAYDDENFADYDEYGIAFGAYMNITDNLWLGYQFEYLFQDIDGLDDTDVTRYKHFLSLGFDF